MDTDSYHMLFDDEEKQWNLVQLILDAVPNRVRDTETMWKAALTLLYAGWTLQASARNFIGDKIPSYNSRAEKACMFCSGGAVGVIAQELDANSGYKELRPYQLQQQVLGVLKEELVERRNDRVNCIAVPDFNDSHTFGEVVQWWRDAGARRGWKFEVNDLPPDMRPFYPKFS